MARAADCCDESDGLPDNWHEELAEKNLRDCAGDAVFKRGRTYFEDAKVRLAKSGKVADPCRATFKVKGTQTYTTELYFEEGLLGSDCTCPHAYDGAFCKHMVAAGLFWYQNLAENKPTSPENRAPSAIKNVANPKRQTATADKREALRKFVNAQSASALADRLWAWAEEDRACMGELKAWAAQSHATDDPKALKSVVSDLLKSSGFLDWRDCARYSQRAEKVLPLLEETLKANPELAREACEHALRRLYKVAEHADDSGGGEIGNLLHEVMDVLLRALEASPPPIQWVDEWFSLVAADPWGLWSDELVLDAAGPAVRQGYSQRVAKDWQAWMANNSSPTAGKTATKKVNPTYIAASPHNFDYARSRLRTRYLSDLRRQQDNQTVLEVMRASLSNSSEHCELVAYCEALKKPREALQFAQAACKLYPSDWQCEDALLRCYDRDGWDKEALALRRQRLEKSPSLENYRAVLSTAKTAGHDVAQYRSELFAWAKQRELERPLVTTLNLWRTCASTNQGKDVSMRVQWLLADGELEEALALVQPPQVCDLPLLRTIAAKLPKARNAEAVPLLLRVFAWEMPRASTPYREVLDLVRDAATRMPQPQRDKWLESLRVEYKPKRNFVKGLDPLKIAA